MNDVPDQLSRATDAVDERRRRIRGNQQGGQEDNHSREEQWAAGQQHSRQCKHTTGQKELGLPMVTCGAREMHQANDREQRASTNQPADPASTSEPRPGTEPARRVSTRTPHHQVALMQAASHHSLTPAPLRVSSMVRSATHARYVPNGPVGGNLRSLADSLSCTSTASRWRIAPRTPVISHHGELVAMQRLHRNPSLSTARLRHLAAPGTGRWPTLCSTGRARCVPDRTVN